MVQKHLQKNLKELFPTSGKTEMMEMLKYIRWLSLDIVLGGVVFLNFIGKQLKVEVPTEVSLAMAVCIWLIYSLDHQRDVRHKIHQKGARRIFHKKSKSYYFNLIICGLLRFDPFVLLTARFDSVGFSPCTDMFLYLILSAELSFFLVKEVFVAVLYGGGIFLFPLIRIDQFEGIHGFILLQLSLLAFVNIVLISTFELEEDRFNGFASLSLSMGKRATSQLLGVLLIISGLAALIMSYYNYFMHLELIYLFATLQLTIILLRPSWFIQAERYRIFSDAIFFYPLIFLY